MHKTTRYLLLGVIAFALIAYFGTRHSGQKPASGPNPVATAPAPEADTGATAAAPKRAPQPAMAGEVQALLSANGCVGCHAIDIKVLGPSYRDVAARYKGDPQAVEKVTASIRKGGAERWGDAVMPAMPNLNEAQAQLLAEFVLEQ